MNGKVLEEMRFLSLFSMKSVIPYVISSEFVINNFFLNRSSYWSLVSNFQRLQKTNHEFERH